MSGRCQCHAHTAPARCSTVKALAARQAGKASMDHVADPYNEQIYRSHVPSATPPVQWNTRRTGLCLAVRPYLDVQICVANLLHRVTFFLLTCTSMCIFAQLYISIHYSYRCKFVHLSKFGMNYEVCYIKFF
jgi:hypothetical protein